MIADLNSQAFLLFQSLNQILHKEYLLMDRQFRFWGYSQEKLQNLCKNCLRKRLLFHACKFRSAITCGGVSIEHNFQPTGWKLCSINTPPQVIADLNSQACYSMDFLWFSLSTKYYIKNLYWWTDNFEAEDMVRIMLNSLVINKHNNKAFLWLLTYSFWYTAD